MAGRCSKDRAHVCGIGRPIVALLVLGGLWRLSPTFADDIELSRLKSQSIPWVTPELLEPRGSTEMLDMPQTLDLSARAAMALNGLTAFLDDHHHLSSFGHGMFSVNPPTFTHDGGMAQNWGKITEATILARSMCGGTTHIDRQRDSLEACLAYAEWKKAEPFPVPLARITTGLISLAERDPRPVLIRQIADYQEAIAAKVIIDESNGQGFFGGEDRRWERDDNDSHLGVNGHWLQIFTSGSILQALVRAGRLDGVAMKEKEIRAIVTYLKDPRFWRHPFLEQKVPTSADVQFAGHHHSYLMALIGLAYYAEEFNDVEMAQFVERGYQFVRRFGIPQIGLFGEGCSTANMAYLAVRLSQGGVVDHWEDVDQIVRNHLTELQIRDAKQLRELNRAHISPGAKLADWAKGLNSEQVIDRSQGLFWSDATHPDGIPVFGNRIPEASCLQWVVCCTGNCTKALHVVWDAMVEDDAPSEFATVHLLLNRLSPSLIVRSELPYRGRVTITARRTRSLAVRIPRWVAENTVRATQGDKSTRGRWLGRYLLLPELHAGESTVIEFDVTEREERVELAWQQDQFWQESTQPPSWWPEKPPQPFTLRFRGNTLVDISPRRTDPCYRLYTDRRLEDYRGDAPHVRGLRFLPTDSR